MCGRAELRSGGRSTSCRDAQRCGVLKRKRRGGHWRSLRDRRRLLGRREDEPGVGGARGRRRDAHPKWAVLTRRFTTLPEGGSSISCSSSSGTTRGCAGFDSCNVPTVLELQTVRALQCEAHQAGPGLLTPEAACA